MASLDSIFQQYPLENIQWEYNLSENDNHYTTPLVTINEGLKSFFGDYGPIRFYTIKEFTDFGGLTALKEHYNSRGDRYQIPVDIHSDTKHYLFIQSYRENNFRVFEELVAEFDGKTFIENYYTNAVWFNRFAGFYLANDKIDDALEILEIGLIKFPDASILHNGMGDYYKTIGEVKDARKWYKKAISIAERNGESELPDYINNLESL
jgi:tetratricopeptide (TPR) repeat protein